MTPTEMLLTTQYPKLPDTDAQPTLWPNDRLTVDADGPARQPTRQQRHPSVIHRKEGRFMARNASVSRTDPAVKGQQTRPGDDAEPQAVSDTDLSFDPADLEQSADPAPAPGPDPFDPASLRLSEDFNASMGVKKALLTVPVRKPDKSWFVRVHPDPDYRLQTAVIELKEDRETYLVAPALWKELTTESTFSPRALFTTINRQGVLFLWPIRLPGADGKLDEWSRSAFEAADLAGKGWVRVAANMALGAYEVFQATGPIPDPEWPASPFKDLLRVAFKDRFITTLDHPVLRRLRGEV